jgi:TonB family protein
MKAIKAIGGAVGIIVALAGSSYAQDPLGAAKDLYASASYEEALSRLSQLAAGATPDLARQIDQYRAFSLFALGRAAEAEQVAEALFRGNPLLKLAEGEASPRIEAMFAAVRKRILPILIRDEYRTARTAIDSGDMKAAEPHLTLVSRMLAEVRAAGPIDETLSDLSLVVDGFLGLSQAAAKQQAAREAAVTPAAPSSSPTRPGNAPPAATGTNGAAANGAAASTAKPATVAEAMARTTTIYSGAADTRLTPPVIINQASPELPRAVSEVMKRTERKTMIVDLVINERGEVQEASIREPVEQVYDLLVLRTARQWKYRPATFDGVPVKFRKSVTVSFLE